MKNLVEVLVSIGSNIEPKLHITNSINALDECFDDLKLSKCYESRAVGFKGGNFLNMVVAFNTLASISEINNSLHQIEDNEGRVRVTGKVWDSRTLDLDILLYGDESGVFEGVQLPRPEILEHAHVLIPLAELAGNKRHPEENITYAELLLNANFSGQDIWEATL